MNKQYKVDPEGNMIVVTDTGKVIYREDKHTKNTDEILSLENVVESLEKKKDYFKDELDILKKEHNNNIKSISSYTPICFLVGVFLIIIYKSFSLNILLIFLSSLTAAFIATFIPDILKLINDNNEIKKHHQKINIESHRLKKIKKRIDALTKDTTPSKEERTDNKRTTDFIDVKPISNYYDASDYFIMNYIIDKKTKNENPSKKKVRKLTKEDKQIYKF